MYNARILMISENTILHLPVHLLMSLRLVSFKRKNQLSLVSPSLIRPYNRPPNNRLANEIEASRWVGSDSVFFSVVVK